MNIKPNAEKVFEASDAYNLGSLHLIASITL